VGFQTGVAAHLAFWLIMRPAEIQFIPAFLFLDRLWLLIKHGHLSLPGLYFYLPGAREIRDWACHAGKSY